ncbi:MAG: hypothetical protein KBS58_05775 [Bacteroidales bacterium]|nr:hypothetical protein [Candidatus Cacconaster equi]
MSSYDDIINLPHWNPKSHPRMSEGDRAAQFAPFAALTGYDAMVSETARLTDSRDDLDEDQMLALNEALSMIVERLGEHPQVLVTWFRKDPRKKGGPYIKTEGTIRDVELTNRILILKEGSRISLDDIVSINLLT